MTDSLAIALAEQVNTLLKDAPPDCQIAQDILTIAPLLAQIAQTTVKSSHYYVLKTEAGEVLKMTLTHRTQSNVEKTVIWAFSTLEDASKEIDSLQDSNISPIKIPVLELLFQFWTLNWCEALVFFEQSGDRNQGQAISHQQLTQKLKSLLKEQRQQRTQDHQRSNSGKGFGKVC